MYGLFALFVTIDDQVEVVACFRDQCDELLTFAVSFPVIIHQGEISGGCQPVDTGFGAGACKELQEAQDHCSVDIEGIAIVRLCGRNVIHP